MKTLNMRTGGDNSKKDCFGRKANSSGNLEISLGIGRLEKFSGKDENIPEQCRKRSGHGSQFLFCKVS